MMDSALLDLLEGVAKRVAEKKVTKGVAGAFVRRVLHGPAIGLVVKLTPTPLDDLALEFLRDLVPAA